MNAKEFADLYLRGVGQVFLQNNPISGAIFLIGIFYNSIDFGIGAALGTLVGTITGFALKYNKKDLQNGLHGFNGTLTGIAAILFFGFNLKGLIFLLIGSFLSAIIMHYLKNFLEKYRLPALTAPFVYATWVIVLIGYLSNVIKLPITTPQVFESGFLNLELFWTGILSGVGQVMLQYNFITGIIFLVGIFVNSRELGIFAFISSIIGAITAVLSGFSVSGIMVGIFSFNAVLTGIALRGAFLKLNYKSILYVFLGAVVSVFVTAFLITILNVINFPILTFPFVVTTTIFLIVKPRLIEVK